MVAQQMSTGPRPPDVIRVPGTDRVFKRRRILVVLLSELAVALMAISSINVALPSIETALGASDTDLQVMLSGYALTYGIVLVAAGRIGDLIGHSTMFVVGISVFTAASLCCGLADSPMILNIFRILQGIGSGIASPQVNGTIVRYFEGRQRAMAFSYFGLTVSVAVSIAPTLTGLLIRALGPDAGWRASFLWNVPIGLTAVVLAMRWLPFGTERARKLGLGREAWRLDLDPVGMVLLGGAVVTTMAPFLIKQPCYFLLLIAALVLGIAWVTWERHYAATGRAPMVDLGLFRHPSFTHAVVISGSYFLGATSIFSIMALFMQNGLGASALASGMIGLPNAIAAAISSLWAGNHVLARGRSLVVGAFMIYTASILGCIGVARFCTPGLPSLAYWPLAIPLTLTGIAAGAITSINQTLSQLDIPPETAATAGAVKQVAERTGTAVGNAVTTAVLFALVPISWNLGFTSAYAIIALIGAGAMVLSILDLRALGDPHLEG